MYKKRSVLRVRYRNSNETLSRPHKIQKIIDTEGKTKYFTMANSREIDPSTFVTKWENKKAKKPTVKPEEDTTTEVIRVRFKDSRKKGNGLGRPTRIYKLTTGEKVEYKRYNPNKNFSSAIDPEDFITEWEKGKTPTPRPLRKYTDEQLMKLGYSLEELHIVRGRTYSAKQVNKLRKLLGGTKNVSGDEARKHLDEHGGMHKAKEALADEIEQVKKRREEAQENVTHMGKFTHPKTKKPPKNPKESRPKKKMTKSQKKKGRRGF